MTFNRYVITLIASILVSCGNSGFIVNETKVNGIINSNKSAAMEKIDAVKGENLLTFSMKEIVESLKSDEFIKAVSYEKILPDILLVNIYEKLPVGRYSEGGKRFTVLEDGSCVKNGPGGPLEFIFQGEPAKKKELGRFLEKVRALGLYPVKIEFHTNYMTITLDDEFQILTDRDLEKLENVEYMDFIRSNISKNEGEKILGLDMRYGGQAIMILGGKQ